MRFDPRQLGARCNQCPIFAACRGRIQPVGPKYAEPRDADRSPLAVIIAEAPGETEQAVGKPLVGQSGQAVDAVLETQFHILEHDAPIPSGSRHIHKTNALMCKPPRKLSDKEWRQALHACRPRLALELDRIKQLGWNGRAIVLGSKALQAVAGHKRVTEWMGPPLDGRAFDGEGYPTDSEAAIDIDFRDISVLPTVHPAMVLRQPWWSGVFTVHLMRGWEYCTGVLPEWKWASTFIEPGQAQLDALMRYSMDAPLAMDIETDGPWHPITWRYNKKRGELYRALNLLDIGFSDGRTNVCVQWHKVYPQALAGDPIARHIIARTVELVIAHPQSIWQNLLYDLVALPAIPQWHRAIAKVWEWFPELELPNAVIPQLYRDTMIMFKLVCPLLPAGLAFITALLTHAPRWKDEFKSGGDDPSLRYAAADPTERAIYCARDCQATHIAWVQLTEQLDFMPSGWSLHTEQMELLSIALHMQTDGINVDQTTFKAHYERLSKSAAKYLKQQRGMVDRTGGMDGIHGLKADKKALERGWNPNSRFHIIRYFARAGHEPRVHTETGDPSYSAKVLEGMCKMTQRPQISDMARAVLSYRKDHKELSTYITGLPYREMEDQADGLGRLAVARIHPSWQPIRAKSGRWGCQGPNVQNQTKKVRDMFIGDYMPDVEIEYA